MRRNGVPPMSVFPAVHGSRLVRRCQRIEVDFPQDCQPIYEIKLTIGRSCVTLPLHFKKQKGSVYTHGKEEKSDQKNEAWLRREFSYTSYSQSFAIPDDVEMSKITAKIENGVLDIDLPKKEVVKETPVTRQIEIQ